MNKNFTINNLITNELTSAFNGFYDLEFGTALM